MYGQVIGKSIAVDCFDKVTKDGIFFLTEGQLKDPLPAHVDRVYTSNHNKWLLQTKCKMDPKKIIGLDTNQQFLIQDKIKNLDFHVTLLNAKQKPGSVMFLFEGKEIGNILYAGKCCYSDSFFSKPLTNFLKVKLVDYLYVHAACEDCQSHSMSTSEAIDNIVNTLRLNPNRKIIICEPYFREDILTSLKLRLRKPISVSRNIMRHLEELGMGSDFTLDQTTAQVIVTEKSIGKVNRFNPPVFKIILAPCSMMLSGQEMQSKVSRLEKKGYQVLIYRNHCSPLELVTLARCINAKHTVLVRPTAKCHPSERPRDLGFWAHVDVSQIIGCLDSFSERTKTSGINGEAQTIKCPCVEEVELETTAEANPPESFVLIESDLESNPS